MLNIILLVSFKLQTPLLFREQSCCMQLITCSAVQNVKYQIEIQHKPFSYSLNLTDRKQCKPSEPSQGLWQLFVWSRGTNISYEYCLFDIAYQIEGGSQAHGMFSCLRFSSIREYLIYQCRLNRHTVFIGGRKKESRALCDECNSLHNLLCTSLREERNKETDSSFWLALYQLSGLPILVFSTTAFCTLIFLLILEVKRFNLRLYVICMNAR